MCLLVRLKDFKKLISAARFIDFSRDLFDNYLTRLLSSHLSMSSLRKSTRLSSLKYGNSFLSMSFLRVPCLILR